MFSIGDFYIIKTVYVNFVYMCARYSCKLLLLLLLPSALKAELCKYF